MRLRAGLDLPHDFQKLDADEYDRRLRVLDHAKQFVLGASPVQRRDRTGGLAGGEPDFEELDGVLADKADWRPRRKTALLERPLAGCSKIAGADVVQTKGLDASLCAWK